LEGIKTGRLGIEHDFAHGTSHHAATGRSPRIIGGRAS
jgi:hypothetical protein